MLSLGTVFKLDQQTATRAINDLIDLYKTGEITINRFRHWRLKSSNWIKLTHQMDLLYGLVIWSEEYQLITIHWLHAIY